MANIIDGNVIDIGDFLGCCDPLASNTCGTCIVDGNCATLSGVPQPDLGGTYTNGPCQYKASVIEKCTDPAANNYCETCVYSCPNNDCCEYGEVDVVDGSSTVISVVWNPEGGGEITTDPCEGIITEINPTTNVVEQIISNHNYGSVEKDCCNPENGWLWTDLGGNVDGRWECISPVIESNPGLCEGILDGSISTERLICVDCDNFAAWDNLYEARNGASLQDTNQDLWDALVEIITSDPTNPLNGNFGNGSFYFDEVTGDLIETEDCCDAVGGVFYTTLTDSDVTVSACLCNTTPEEAETICECLTTVDDYVNLVATTQGRNLYLNVETLTSLGLTQEQSLFVVNNLFNPNDNNNDEISDNVNARILVNNVLSVTGGFYVCYESSPTLNRINSDLSLDTPINRGRLSAVNVSQTKCIELSGFYDEILCYCEPQEECNLSFTDISVIIELDDFNQQQTIATFNGGTITQACCLSIASENNLPWVWQEYNGQFRCYTVDPDPCLPLEFNLNQNLIKPECNTPLDVSVSFYFGTPENPCVEPDDEDDDIIIVTPEPDPCLLEFDAEGNLVDYNSTKVSRSLPPRIPPHTESVSEVTPCCYNPKSPITARIIIRDENDTVVQTGEEFGTVDLETWVDVDTTFALTGDTEGYNISLQFTSGLNCCCVYDIFLDNFKFTCSEDLNITEFIKNDCPGFNITPVIDNKKSWVYNPGDLNYSNIQNQVGTLTDNVIIKNGEYGLIEGNGEINRRFAPSPDADLPWRYTDYFKQSSVLEKHSNLILNSKELYLTFDMCSDCCVKYSPCPAGYTLSAGTETCYKHIISKQFQSDELFQFQDGEWYDFMDFNNP